MGLVVVEIVIVLVKMVIVVEVTMLMMVTMVMMVIILLKYHFPRMALGNYEHVATGFKVW